MYIPSYAKTTSRAVALATVLASAAWAVPAAPRTPPAKSAAAVTTALHQQSDPIKPIKPIVIGDSPGGTVSTFAAFYRAIRGSHAPVVLHGWCVSACTLILSLPRWQTCIEPTGLLGFHEADAGLVPDKALSIAYARRYYPPAVVKWFVKHALSPFVTLVGSDEIVKRGWMRACRE